MKASICEQTGLLIGNHRVQVLRLDLKGAGYFQVFHPRLKDQELLWQAPILCRQHVADLLDGSRESPDATTILKKTIRLRLGVLDPDLAWSEEVFCFRQESQSLWSCLMASGGLARRGTRGFCDTRPPGPYTSAWPAGTSPYPLWCHGFSARPISTGPFRP